MIDQASYFRQILNNSSAAVFFTDTEHRLTYVNAIAAKTLCINASELERGDDETAIFLQDLQISVELTHTIRQAYESTCDNDEANCQIEESGIQFSRIRCTRIRDASDNAVGFAYELSFDQDSPKAKFDRIILSNLMNQSQDFIFFKDRNSRFIRCSQSLADRIGLDSAEDMVGRTDFEFWEKECASQFFNDDQSVLASGQPITSKPEPERREDGSQTWILTSKMPLLDDAGNVIGVFGTSKDISQQKEMERELESTNKSLVDASRRAGMAEIATNVLHNVGNVLNSINISVSHVGDITRASKVGNLQKLADLLSENAHCEGFLSTDEKGSRVPKYLRLITEELESEHRDVECELESTKRHLEHIRTIVAMQQKYATATNIVEDVDLAQVLEDAIRMSSNSLSQHNIELVRNFETGVLVSIDKHRVLQILVNLIRNAKHAFRDADTPVKRITVTADTSAPTQFCVSVSDNGVGISKEDLVKLFRHGFTTKKNGHGFGLHSGANAAHELGGSLVADSEGLGHGATFTLTLPTCEVSQEFHEKVDV